MSEIQIWNQKRVQTKLIVSGVDLGGGGGSFSGIWTLANLRY